MAATFDEPQSVPRRCPLPQRRVAASIVIVGVPLFIATLDNSPFWSNVLRATTHDEHQLAILLSMFVVLFAMPAIVLALATGTRLLKVAAAVLLLLSAACSFFMSEYGIVIDTSMIRNVVETELREASPLLSGAFLMHLFVFGIVPAAATVFAPVGCANRPRELVARAGIVVLSAAALGSTLYFNYGAVSFFAQQHHSVRLLMNPAYPIYSYIRFLLRADDRPPASRLPLDARVTPGHGARRKRTLLVLVMGETARADRFSFNGYGRDTNRYTRERGVVNFPRVTSCGTSTADSLPCVFSRLDRIHFDHAAATAEENLFGVLGRLGISVLWRDNSTGCKDICDTEHFERLTDRRDPALCDSTGCVDEILLEDLDRLVADASRDRFIVLHQRGSHGPAYHTNVPPSLKEFLPECEVTNLRNCALDALNNAYDNTILYTDYFLARLIDLLSRQRDRYDVAMLYASDHGESLGERGLYLHGFPYALAPPEQIQVPMLFWASTEFEAAHALDAACVREAAKRPASHDFIFHSVLSLFDIETSSYVPELDLFAPCRAGPGVPVFQSDSDSGPITSSSTKS